jgi:2-oxo-hept-3-ene-1,7-dioate hydratase
LAFVLKKKLYGSCSIQDVLDATDYAVPAIEILDTRIQRVDPETKTTRKIFDTVSDNAANAGVVLGSKRIDVKSVDLRWIGALCYKNEQIEETGLAAGVLDHPAQGIVWLVDRLTRRGHSLEPGHTVLAGSFIRPIEAREGDHLWADFDRFGTVECRFD